MVTQKHKKKKGFEQKSEVRMYERAKEQIPNPAEKTTNKSRKIITGNMGNFAQQRDGLKNSDKTIHDLTKTLNKKVQNFSAPPTRPVEQKTLFSIFLTNRKKNGWCLFRIYSQSRCISVLPQA